MIHELRTYTINEGKMGEWLRVFEKDLIPLHKAHRIPILAAWQNTDSPNEFVWLRSFQDSEHQKSARAALYGSDAWKAMQDRVRALIAKVEQRNVAPTAFSPLK